jgi:hypothetical protein
MRRLLRYSSSRFAPRINDYTYPERRTIRLLAGGRSAWDPTMDETRSGFSHRKCADARR